MVSIRKAGGAIVAGLMLAASLGQAVAPTVATAATTTASQSATQSESKATFTRTDAAYDGTSTPMISMIEGREFRAVAPVEGKSLSELKRLVKDGKVSWTLSRGKGQFSKKTYPNQWLGGKLSDWKTVATKDGAAEGGNGITTDEKVRKSRDFLYDVRVSAQEVDGTPSIVLTFKNRELYEGLDGIDVRSREFVRASMYDYVGTYKLACDVDGTQAASTDVTLRPYDVFATQTDIDAELPKLAKEAKANGMYAEVRTFGTSAKGRPMRALFVSKQKSDLDDYQALKQRMEKVPASVQADLAAGKLSYKVPVVYSNVHADEIVASDAVMQFARDLVANKPVEYRRATGLTSDGKAELKTEMDHDRTVWSDLIKDDVQGIGYIRGDGGKGHGTNYDGADTDTASSDLSDQEFEKYYDSDTQTFDPSKSLDDVFYILVPSENVDARTDDVRTNGNGFDLNRDNTYQTQPETQAMSGLISEWDPISLHEVHGYYQQFQVEPCSPTHDPNNEYDLFIDTALAQGEAFMGAAIANNPTINSVQMPMRDYLKLEDDGTRFWEAPFDDMSTSYTPQYAMMHGTNAYTVEAPYGTADAVDALRYGFMGNAGFVAQNKDRMFNNQLERFRRGVQNIDADSIRPYYVNQKDEKGAEADTFRPRDSKDANGKTNGNFFPEYYVIPMDPKLQKNRAAAAETINFLIHNDVQVSQTTKAVKAGEKSYPAGTIVVDMHQAKRNMANCALYPNLVISDWTQYSLYSEPVTNFSQFRGFDMDTIRTAGSFSSAGMKEIDKAPKQRSEVTGKGGYAVIKNNGLEAIKAVNALLKDGKTVGLVTKGKHEGDYVVKSDDLGKVKGDYVLTVTEADKAPTAKKIDGSIKAYVPKAYAKFQQDAAGNKVGMADYENRLNTNGNWDGFALAKQMGFELTDDLDEATIIVGSQYPVNANAVAAKVKSGTPYVAYTADALQFVKDYKLAGKFSFTPSDGDWLGFDAFGTVEFPKGDIITATYANEGDHLMYGYGGGYIKKAPAGSKVLVKTTDDPLVEGFMPKDDIKKYQDTIQAVDYQKDGRDIALFANTLTNKAHQQDDYRYLTAAVYSKQLDGDFGASQGQGNGTVVAVVCVVVVAGVAYAVVRKRKASANAASDAGEKDDET
jgi:hypothetical protein